MFQTQRNGRMFKFIFNGVYKCLTFDSYMPVHNAYATACATVCTTMCANTRAILRATTRVCLFDSEQFILKITNFRENNLVYLLSKQNIRYY